jgi:translation elongation factor EF-Ts
LAVNPYVPNMNKDIYKMKSSNSETNNNLGEAEVWLKSQAQAQGWAKAQKLQGRNTSQGLLGLTIQVYIIHTV